MGRCLAALVMLFLAAPALAQTGAVGTGEDGCYFGKCEGDRRDTRQDDNRFEREQNNTPGPLMCRTHFGSCQMGVFAQVGSICNCPQLAQGYTSIGVVQASNAPSSPLPNIASICATPIGSCQLGVQLGRFETCYCPTFNGPVWGGSQ